MEIIASELIQSISTGADVATLCIFYLLWRMDKRISTLELERKFDREKLAKRTG